MSLFALKNQNYTSHPAYHFRFDSMGVNEPKNFSDPCQLWSNYHYCYLLQQTLTNICTSHLGSLYCIYCTYSVCPREKGFKDVTAETDGSTVYAILASGHSPYRTLVKSEEQIDWSCTLALKLTQKPP